MRTDLRGRHFITHEDWNREELDTIIEVAFYLKMLFGLGFPHEILKNKTLFMIFFDSSTRTRNSFEAGMTQLGGHAHFLSPSALQISHGEGPKDTAEVLSRYGHGISIRYCTYNEGHKYLREVEKYASIPVINMQDDVYHPPQIMGDLLTMMEKFSTRNLKGLKLGVSWTHAPNYVRPISVPQSLITLMPRYGIDVVLAHPPEFNLQKEIVELAQQRAQDGGGNLKIVSDPQGMDEAFKDADVVIPKSWGPLVYTQDQKEGIELIKKYPSWRCDFQMMSLTKKHALYMHPLPADRGFEVTNEVIDGPHSVVKDEAENRLHIQKALMALIMGNGRL